MNINKTKNVPAERGENRVSGKAELTRDLPVFTPAADIYENDDSLLVVCDMPGVEEKNVEIGLEDDVLTITGNQGEYHPENYQLVYQGYHTGIYRRAFTLTTGIDQEKIKARLSNGVLSITLPKSAAAKPRKIAIEAG